MSDPADIATGAVGGATGGGLLWWVVTRLLRRGEAAEALTAERGEAALEDHKKRLHQLEELTAKQAAELQALREAKVIERVAALDEWSWSQRRPPR